jgi:gliding motility-associated-like protein
MEIRVRHTVLGLLLLLPSWGFAQQYFKLLEQSAIPYEQKIARFSNGDLLIGGSPIRGRVAGQNGGVNLVRLDPCGNVVWARNFQWKQNFLTFKDFVITPDDEAFIYGTAYEGNSEYIFLLKLSPKGNELGFQMLHMGTVDNFTYNIEVLPSGALMAYGLLLDFSTTKRGFLAVFSDKLVFQWGKVFGPFESNGEATLSSDGGFLCRSGIYTFKFSSNGDLEWASTFESDDQSGDFLPVAGPIRVADGYLFEALFEQDAFFYKTDLNGRLLWKTELFKSSNRAADILVLENGDFLVAYNDPGPNENYPSQLRISSGGQIYRQRRLLIQQSLQTDAIHQSLGKRNVVTIIGAQDIKAAAADRYSGFLLQTALDSSQGTCFRWQDFRSTRSNSNSIGLNAQAVTFFPLNIRLIDAKMDAGPLEYNFAPSCDLTKQKLIRQDSTLKCDQSWEISLPNAEFRWEDGTPGTTRTLSKPGLYRASDYNCISSTVYEYEVKKEACACKLYLPNAFSPNGDGQNDWLEVFSDCTLQTVDISVYSRWGDRVFQAATPQPKWDGNFRGKPVERGVYLVVIRYSSLNENAEAVVGTLVQNVLVLRE